MIVLENEITESGPGNKIELVALQFVLLLCVTKLNIELSKYIF